MSERSVEVPETNRTLNPRFIQFLDHIVPSIELVSLDAGASGWPVDNGYDPGLSERLLAAAHAMKQFDKTHGSLAQRLHTRAIKKQDSPLSD